MQASEGSGVAPSAKSQRNRACWLPPSWMTVPATSLRNLTKEYEDAVKAAEQRDVLHFANSSRQDRHQVIEEAAEAPARACAGLPERIQEAPGSASTRSLLEDIAAEMTATAAGITRLIKIEGFPRSGSSPPKSYHQRKRHL